MGSTASKPGAGTASRSATPSIPDPSTEEGFTDALRLHLQRLIVYAEGTVPELQREVAEKLANEAVKPQRQAQIVELGGLQLLLPLTRSSDPEVQRLAAHALANLSVLPENQVKMANEGKAWPEGLPPWVCVWRGVRSPLSRVAGGLEMLVRLLQSPNELVQRQAAKGMGRQQQRSDTRMLLTRATASPSP